jgi:UDPglucose 6-dehydrogenase
VDETSSGAVVAVAGAGYVGLTTGACLAYLGHVVTIIDVDAARIEGLQAARLPVSEPGLTELVAEGVAKGTLRFTTSVAEAVDGAEFHFVCVPTPDDGGGNTDLSMVEAAVAEAAPHLAAGSLIVVKSTVPIGTCRRLADEVARFGVGVVSNPEFLQAGDAVARMLSPSRIVVGAESEESADRVVHLYESLEAPVIRTDTVSAELVKLAGNAYLSVRLSFINEVAALGGMVGADIDDLLDGVGADPRIGRSYLEPGPGWGGSCLPKDARSLYRSAAGLGVELAVLQATLDANERQFDRVVAAVADGLDGGLAGHRIGVWGLTFKSGTDDQRDSPSLRVVERLIAAGASVRAHDPQVSTAPKDGMELADSAHAAVADADALLVMTGWPEYGGVDPADVAAAMAGHLVVDARGMLDLAAYREAGLDVRRFR